MPSSGTVLTAAGCPEKNMRLDLERSMLHSAPMQAETFCMVIIASTDLPCSYRPAVSRALRNLLRRVAYIQIGKESPNADRQAVLHSTLGSCDPQLLQGRHTRRHSQHT